MVMRGFILPSIPLVLKTIPPVLPAVVPLFDFMYEIISASELIANDVTSPNLDVTNGIPSTINPCADTVPRVFIDVFKFTKLHLYWFYVVQFSYFIFNGIDSICIRMYDWNHGFCFVNNWYLFVYDIDLFS